MDQDNNLIIKFSAGALDQKFNAKSFLNNVVGKSTFEEVKQLFPGEADQDLGSIYIAKIIDKSKISEVIDSLNNETKIDYAHAPSIRNPF